MAGPTTLSVGSVTITASGGATGSLLAKIISQTASGVTVIQVGSLDASIPAPTGTAPFELVINPGYTGDPSVPSGYTWIINGSSEALSGGGAGSAIVGNNLNYSGGAGTILATGTGGTITDSASSADVNVSTGNYTVNASGNNDTVNLDTGTSSNVNVTGTGSTINLGGNGSGGSAAAAGATVSGPNVVNIGPGNDTVNALAGTTAVLFDKAQLVLNATGGSDTLVTATTGTVTVNATGGTQYVFDNVGGASINAGPATYYESALSLANATTMTGSAGGVDTVFALSGLDYNGSASASTLFIGGEGAVSVIAGAASTLFGGSGGGVYSENTVPGSFFFWGRSGIDAGTGSTSDTILGSDGSKGTVWGNSNETITVQQSSTAPAIFNAGNEYVAFGNNDSINASLSAGGDVFLAYNASIGSFNFTGDTTLVGSTAGQEEFLIFNAAIGGAAQAGAHTITIVNWQATDQMLLGGYPGGATGADVTGLQAAQTAAAGGSFHFTLSDNTTINFVGPHTGGGLIFG